MTEVVAHEGRRDVRTIAGTFAEVDQILRAHRHSIEVIRPMHQAVHGMDLYEAEVRLLPEAVTRPIVVGRAVLTPPGPKHRVSNDVVPSAVWSGGRVYRQRRWVRWALVAVGLVALVVIAGLVAVWLFAPDAPKPTPAPSARPQGHDDTMAGLVGALAVMAGLAALLKWAGGGRTFSGTFTGKMD